MISVQHIFVRSYRSAFVDLNLGDRYTCDWMVKGRVAYFKPVASWGRWKPGGEKSVKNSLESKGSAPYRSSSKN